jgi:transcriptional regulator with XRE-family HTH domain
MIVYRHGTGVVAMRVTHAMTGPEVLAELGQRLRAYRLQQNLPIKELAKQAGITPLTLQKAERGHNFTLDTLVRVLRALGRLEQLDAMLPEPSLSPLALLAQERRSPRRRARPRAHGG